MRIAASQRACNGRYNFFSGKERGHAQIMTDLGTMSPQVDLKPQLDLWFLSVK